MNSAITHAILPTIVSVCVECFSRGHIAGLSLSPAEVYSFGVTKPQAQLDRDVDAARALIVARPRTAQRLDLSWLGHWLAQRSSFTREHLDHIPQTSWPSRASWSRSWLARPVMSPNHFAS